MSQLNSFSKVSFICDSCGQEFQQETAYSVARNWEELDDNNTYCANCVERKRKKPQRIEVQLPLMKSAKMFNL